MPMNEHNTFRHPVPQPMCAALKPLLPLLSLGKLESDETGQVWEHVATCGFCQSQLDEFDAVRDALRSFDGSVGTFEALMPLETILDAADSPDGEDDDLDRDDHMEVSRLGIRHGTLRPFPGTPPRRGRERLSALGALAAVLILAVLASAIFKSHQPGSQQTTMPGVGTLRVFPLPGAGSHPRLIVTGPDGNLWFTEDARIGRITPQGAISEFALPAGITLGDIVQGPDQALWFTDTVSGTIDRVELYR